MIDILDTLNDIRREQFSQPGELILIRSDVMQKAEEEIIKLKKTWVETGNQIAVDRHDAIVNVIDEIREARARIVIDMAFTGDYPVNMMAHEVDVFEQLCPLMGQLRGAA